MTYQVLARKWRPKGFASLVGQEHVVKALVHALEQQRLHHAYLFTGTRGVGKTTLARILAKSLNCATGITATACGTCQACCEIDAGRFVDYLEMDAASNRGVDEMAGLLERAIYAPVAARFKVYMIDEVHMLTNHAFNAMLKTLEEPPAHVKFILATTDPQKIPVTVLSRCLQFNLKQMPVPQMVGHLEHILNAENLSFEVQALRLLALAADGSMRDALSLTDQAIAYTTGQITEEAVRQMLGMLDQRYIVRLLEAVAAADGAAVLAIADEVTARSLSYATALQDLARLLHRVAWAQCASGVVLDEWPEAADIRRLAQTLTPEQVQLYYQIATLGRSELALAPDEYAGFTMTLLRMLAFYPVCDGVLPVPDVDKSKAQLKIESNTLPIKSGQTQRAIERAAEKTAEEMSADVLEPSAQVIIQPILGDGAASSNLVPPSTQISQPEEKHEADKVLDRAATDVAAAITVAQSVSPIQASTESPDMDNIELGLSLQKAKKNADSHPDKPLPGQISLTQLDSKHWPALVASLPLRGVAQQLAMQSELLRIEGTHLILRVPLAQLAERVYLDKLSDTLSQYFAQTLKLSAEIGTVACTAAAADKAERAQRQQQAEQAIQQDPFAQVLLCDFEATLVPGSIRPL